MLQDTGWDPKQVKSAMPELIKELDKVHEELFKKESVKLLPGVKNLLSALKTHGAELGLITGNLKTIAKRKLEDAGIYSYFRIGGFGSDPHTTRSDLIEIAVKQAGFRLNKENVYVIGDTPLDIQAAQKAGIANSVGVANGYRTTQELAEAGARIVFRDFKNTSEVLSALGIE